MNERSLNYALPNRYIKLPKKLTKKVKSKFSKYTSKSWDLCNPEPIPYQRDAFKPSTISKVIDIPKRLIDGFMEHEYMDSQPQRGIILHTERYVWSSMKEVYKSQNERLIAEENYLKKAKFLKKMSESRLKISNQNLILEGENFLSSQHSEKPEFNHKRIYSHSIVDALPEHPITDNIRNTEKEIEEFVVSQPISMAVHKIQLKNRGYGSDTISSAPINTLERPHDNMNTHLQRSSAFDTFPAITNNQRYSENIDRNSVESFNSHTDYDSAYRQSERFNRPNVRINEYIMDGKPMKFTERADIQGELKYLKSIILPSIARELYVGRGIQLPSNHATKIPRGKYVGNEIVKMPVINSDIRIETPNGGSVTINTNTPNDIQVLNNQSAESEVVVVSMTEETPTIEDYFITKEELVEKIKAQIRTNQDGFMESQDLNDKLFENSKFSQEWKAFVTIIIGSVDLINIDQLSMVFDTEFLSKSFQNDFPNFEVEEAKEMIPLIFKLMNQSENYFKFEDILSILNSAKQIIETIKQIEELYNDFKQHISQDNHSSLETISKDHVLLFIPYILRKLGK